MRRLVNVIRGMGPRVGDALLAGVAVVALAVEVVVFSDGDAGSLAIGGFAALSMASLVVRRSRPLLVAIAIAAMGLVTALTAPDVFTNMSTLFIATMVTMYSVGRHAPAVAPAIAVIVLMGIATIVTDSLEAPQQILWLGVLTGGPLAIGRVMRNRTRLQEQLRESTEVLERDRTRSAESAVEDERARLAGELQALIANGVSAIVLHAEAVPRVVAAGEPERADAALSRIEQTGRETLAETRRLLGILRRDGDARALAPQPTLAELPRLAELVREQGLAVDLEVDGERGEIAAGLDLAAYRVVQQGLEDAVSAGARRARIVVHFGSDELRLEVGDNRHRTTIDPERLLALRERLGLYGARLRAGQDESGQGFALVAHFPLNGVVA